MRRWGMELRVRKPLWSVLAPVAIIVAAGLAASAHAAVPAVHPAPPRIGRWEGRSGPASILFTVEQNTRHSRRYVVRPEIYCPHHSVTVGATPSAWPISATGSLSPVRVNLSRLTPPFVGHFDSERGAFTLDRAAFVSLRHDGCRGAARYFTARWDPDTAIEPDGLWEGTSRSGIAFSTFGGGSVIDLSVAVVGSNCGYFKSDILRILRVRTGGVFQVSTPGFRLSGRFSGSAAAGAWMITRLGCRGQEGTWSTRLVKPASPPVLAVGSGRLEVPSPRPVTRPTGTAVLRRPNRCAAVRVIGVRGSGEDPTTDRAMGLLPHSLAVDLAQSVRPVGVTGEGLDYPAVGVAPGNYNFHPVEYGASVGTGERKLVRLMSRRHRHCPRETWVLAAYSQGAQVVGDVLATFPPGAGQVAAVILWADPKYSPKSRSDRGAATGWGLLSDPAHHDLVRPPSAWTSRTESWCNPLDIVCDGLGLNHTISAHLTYQDWALTPAESFAATKVRDALRPPAEPSPVTAAPRRSSDRCGYALAPTACARGATPTLSSWRALRRGLLDS